MARAACLCLFVHLCGCIDLDGGAGCQKQGYKAAEDKLSQQVMDAEGEAARVLQLLRFGVPSKNQILIFE